MPLLTKSTPKDGIKLAPPIKHLSVVSYERHADQKLWYIVKVTPQQADCVNQQHSSGTTSSATDSSRPHLQRKSYLIARRYEQFCHLDQQLRSDFSSSILSTIRSRRSSQQHLLSYSSPFSLPLFSAENINMNDLPKLNKLQRKLLPAKPVNNERQSELHRYCQELIQLPTQVTHSLLVLEFFGLHKADTERIVFSSMACLSASRLSYVAPSSTPLQSPPPSSVAATAPSSPSLSHSAVPPSPLSPIVSRRSRSIVLDDDTEASHRLVKKARSQPNFTSCSPMLPPSPPPLPPLLVTYDDIDIRYNNMGSTFLHSMARLANTCQPSSSHSSSSTSSSSAPSNASIEHHHHPPLTLSTSPPPSLASTEERCGMISPGTPTFATHGSSPFGTTGGTEHKSHKSQHGLDIRHRQSSALPLTISTNVVTNTTTAPIDRVISPEIDVGDQDESTCSDYGVADDQQVNDNDNNDEDDDVLMMMNCITPINMTYDILSLPPSAMTLASSTTRPSTASDFYNNGNNSSNNSSDSLTYLKLKVVYDLDNIILLQVPRTIKLPELRARILHKFDDMAADLPVDFKLVFNSLAPGGRKDSLLSFSAAYSTYANLDARTIIGTQDDLMDAMSKWVDLPKVSVRCVVN